MNISTEWLQAIPKEDRDNFKGLLLNHNNNAILIRLRELVEQRRNQLDHVSLGTYDDNSWSHKQAHINGVRQALDDIKDLLSFTKGI